MLGIAGVIKDLFQWEDAKWIPGKLMKTEWVKSKVIPSHFSSYSVNFSKIDAIARAPWDNNILNSFLNQVLFNFFFSIFYFLIISSGTLYFLCAVY